MIKRGSRTIMNILSAKGLAGRVGAALVGVAAIASGWCLRPKPSGSAFRPVPAQILDAVKPIAAKQGLDIKIIEFTDYVIPNAALASGEIEANSFQHQPYLDNQVQDRGFKLVSVGKTVVFPMQFFDEGEAFRAVQRCLGRDPERPDQWRPCPSAASGQGLIKLSPEAGLKATPIDITENPKKLASSSWTRRSFRSLGDVDAAAVNTNYAIESGLNPLTDAIAPGERRIPYTNVIAVREVDKDKPWVKQLVEAYHTPEVKQFVAEKFKGFRGHRLVKPN